MGSCFTAQGRQHVVGVGDQGFFASAFEEVEHGFDLGFHAAFAELTLRQIFLRVLNAETADRIDSEKNCACQVC